MALPWIIGAAAVAVVGAIAKSVSDSNEEEERQARRAREQREEMEREERRVREEANRKAKEQEKRRAEEEQREKENVIRNSIRALLSDHGMDNSKADSLYHSMKMMGEDVFKSALLKEWDNTQDNSKFHKLEVQESELKQLKEVLRG